MAAQVDPPPKVMAVQVMGAETRRHLNWWPRKPGDGGDEGGLTLIRIKSEVPK